MHASLVVSALFLFAVGVAGVSVASELPRPEHPTPQMVRSEWVNLNGEWEFAETDANSDGEFLKASPYPDRIVVPFCRESNLSGLARLGFVKNVWYRRTFSVPKDWKSPRVLLHVGACDWKARAWVNGQLLGEHVGGSTPFAFDVTPVLKPGENTVVIHAFDDTRSGLQPCGKQSQKEESHGCVYTRTTGIWQTVWLEGVGRSYIREVFVTPDFANGRAVIRAKIDGPTEGLTVAAAASATGKAVGAVKAAPCGGEAYLALDLSEKRAWSLEDPFLYDLKLTLTQGDKTVDAVDSYFGLREITLRGAAFLINGKAVFQRLVLDQGFYPDGIWSAPTDAALKHDIELSKAVGFNGARLHQKVFDPRFLYWADKLGYLVWGEYPNWGANVGSSAVDMPILMEWLEVVRRDRNHPAIIGWCPFNETNDAWSQLQNAVVYATRQADPTRPVLDSSGYVHSLPDPELLDAHDYNQDPASFRSQWENRLSTAPIPKQYGGVGNVMVPFFVSEYGGIGWNIHAAGWGYGNAPKGLDEWYARFAGLTNALLDNRRMFAFCYTQLTDIEQEQNGIYAYDRTPKFDCDKLKAICSRAAACEKDPPVLSQSEKQVTWSVLVGAFPDGDLCHAWQYTTEEPSKKWMDPSFDDSKWKMGHAGFGHKGGWEDRTRTPWTTKDIWLRQPFTYDGAPFDTGLLVAHYDNGAEVYINGKRVWSGTGWNDNYAAFNITQNLRAAVKPGKNVIAVHCHQDEGGQLIDLAIALGR